MESRLPSSPPKENNSSFALRMNQLLQRSAEDRPLEDGFVRCPIDPQHHIPAAALVTHLEQLHLGDPLSSVPDAMYSDASGERRNRFLTMELYAKHTEDRGSCSSSSSSCPSAREEHHERSAPGKRRREEFQCKDDEGSGKALGILPTPVRMDSTPFVPCYSAPAWNEPCFAPPPSSTGDWYGTNGSNPSALHWNWEPVWRYVTPSHHDWLPPPLPPVGPAASGGEASPAVLHSLEGEAVEVTRQLRERSIVLHRKVPGETSVGLAAVRKVLAEELEDELELGPRVVLVFHSEDHRKAALRQLITPKGKEVVLTHFSFVK